MSKKLAQMLKQNTMSNFQSGLEGVPEEVEKPPSPVPAPPAPVNTYNPTTTTFSGANKCCICEKTVYKTEEVIAVGRVWHAACFTCGGAHKDGCNRTLKRDGYVDHDSQPYCNACYNKQFRTKGFGVGTNLNTDFGVGSEPVKESKPEPVQAPAPPTPEPTSHYTPGGFQGVGSVAKSSTPATPEQSSSTTSNYTPGGFQGVGSVAKTSLSTTSPASKSSYTPTNKVPVTNETPKCTACAKSVYKVEEIIAVGRVWHQSCFTCGGTKGEGCKKTLKRDGYVDHENQPFCNACYAKLYKPKGFGYGNTLSTDYGPTADVTAGVSKLSTQEATPPPAPPAAVKPSGNYGGGFQGVGSVAAASRSPVAAAAPSRSPVAGAAPPAPPAPQAPPAPVATSAPAASVAEPVARRPSAGFQGMAAAASAAPVHVEVPARRPSAVDATVPARRPSAGGVQLDKDNVAPFSEETISKFKQPAILNANVPQRRATLNIGGSTSANKDDKLHKEVGYIGDNDEVDESEW